MTESDQKKNKKNARGQFGREFQLAVAAEKRFARPVDDREALVALNLIDGIGPVRARQLLEHFADPPAILNANAS